MLYSEEQIQRANERSISECEIFSHREGRKEIQNTQRAVHRICEDGQIT